MNTRNSCIHILKQSAILTPDDVSKLLNLTPEKTWEIGDLRRNGTMYDFALWEIGKCTEYDVEVENQMRNTISSLWDKIHLLNQIREENEVHLVLEVVPAIYVGDTNPCLAPPLDVIDFCHATRTEIDIDMYVYDSEDE